MTGIKKEEPEYFKKFIYIYKIYVTLFCSVARTIKFPEHEKKNRGLYCSKGVFIELLDLN